MKLLNPGYESNQDLNNNGDTITVNNSLWWNSESGTCYNGNRNATISCDFSSVGLSDEAKEHVVDQTIYLGGGTNSYIYSDGAYKMERGNSTLLSTTDGVARTTQWTGKTAIMYPSDYAYATDLDSCNQNLYNYYNSTCANYNWLRGNSERFVTPNINDNSYSCIWYLGPQGDVYPPYCGSASSSNFVTRPVLTLSSETIIRADGEGTQNNPYDVY